MTSATAILCSSKVDLRATMSLNNLMLLHAHKDETDNINLVNLVDVALMLRLFW